MLVCVVELVRAAPALLRFGRKEPVLSSLINSAAGGSGNEVFLGSALHGTNVGLALKVQW